MNQYWELVILGYLVAVSALGLIIAIWLAWWQDRQRWKRLPRHFGSTYDASSRTTYRPNIDLRRVR